MKPLVIYHDNCADGFGAAFAAWTALGDEAEYIAMAYNKLPEIEVFKKLITQRDVYMVDFSLPREYMNVFFELSRNAVWLDHHKTAFEMWCGVFTKGMERYQSDKNFEIILDDNCSGAMIAWNYFNPDTEVPRLIKYIDDYDRWMFNYPNTKPFIKALWASTPWKFEDWNAWFIDDVDDNLMMYDRFINEGEAVLRAHDQNVQAVIKSSARKCAIPVTETVDGVERTLFKYTGLIANCPYHLTSDVGHHLATESGTFGLLWLMKKDGVIAKCSLRSNNTYDVSRIAQMFGGGGHMNAAGFEVPITKLLEWIP